MPNTTALLDLALTLSRQQPHEDGFNSLISHIRALIQCDAIVLLLRQGEELKPVAMQGLSQDTLGRRFVITEQPRFDAICQAGKPVRFAEDSPLPDPYDGLLIATEDDLPVHSCMGLPLLTDDGLIGLLTLDSLTPGQFEHLSQRTLELISTMVGAFVHNTLLLQHWQQRAHHAYAVVGELTQEALTKDGGELIGDSPTMQQLQQEITLVANTDMTTLIVGETGTGKELVARTLHQQSSRADGPLVHVNCAALPENLIESELFGHRKGAFTGAHQSRAGKFAMASGGTLFLDEVGELPLSVQSTLLRALQNHEIQPLGEDATIQVDVRIIAATNRDLQHEVQQGNFRADLYHRLSVYPIAVPPLRQRQNDISLLSGYFIERMRRKLGLQQLKLAATAQQQLNHYHWPGNVRELEHCISRAALRARGRGHGAMTTIQLQDLDALLPEQSQPTRSTEPANTAEVAVAGLGLKKSTEDFQRQMILQALQQHQGNWAATARSLHVDRANLCRLANRLGISVKKSVVKTVNL